MSVKAVHPESALDYFTYAHGHDLQDVLKGDDLTGEVHSIIHMHAATTIRTLCQLSVLCTYFRLWIRFYS